MQRPGPVDRSEKERSHEVEVDAAIREVQVLGPRHREHVALASRYSLKDAANLGLGADRRGQAALAAQVQEWLAEPRLEHVACQESVEARRTWADRLPAAHSLSCSAAMERSGPRRHRARPTVVAVKETRGDLVWRAPRPGSTGPKSVVIRTALLGISWPGLDEQPHKMSAKEW
jgi:hypothetical protein